jgi:PelA/Pel-15E family pectate lyase
MKIKLGLSLLLSTGLLNMSARAQHETQKGDLGKDPVAENMLVYQRKVGGWPKAIHKMPLNYERVLSEKERLEGLADSLQNDATIDNKATTREIRYLVKAYKAKQNPKYLQAAMKGVDYLLLAQYDNGGWAQYYPDHSLYRAEITYNDNAMVNVLHVLQDIVVGKNDFDLLSDKYRKNAQAAVAKGVSCILKTQVLQNGIPTVWCAQYDEKTLKPAKARAFELISLSGMESVGIVEFLMRMDDPSPEVSQAISAAVAWFEKSKILDYDFVYIDAPELPGGKDRVLVRKTGSVVWARFYDMDTNKPFFSGRNSVKVKTLAEVELERRIGYAWYGTWPAALLQKKYPEWVAERKRYRERLRK